MSGLPCAQDRAVRLDRVDVASLDPHVLRLVHRLLHHDGRGLDDNWLLDYDGLLHHRCGRRGGGGRNGAAENRAANKPRGKRAAVAAMVVVMVVV